MVEVNTELFNEMVTILPFEDGWSHSYMAGMGSGAGLGTLQGGKENNNNNN
jgi:hypothetical protein